MERWIIYIYASAVERSASMRQPFDIVL